MATGANWLLQAAATLPDTIVTKQIQPEATTFEKVVSVASGLASIALLVLAVALVPAAWNFRKSYAKVSDMLDRIYGDINPIMRHASTIADNAKMATTFSLIKTPSYCTQPMTSAPSREISAEPILRAARAGRAAARRRG